MEEIFILIVNLGEVRKIKSEINKNRVVYRNSHFSTIKSRINQMKY